MRQSVPSTENVVGQVVRVEFVRLSIAHSNLPDGNPTPFSKGLFVNFHHCAANMLAFVCFYEKRAQSKCVGEAFRGIWPYILFHTMLANLGGNVSHKLLDANHKPGSQYLMPTVPLLA